ncbi:InlB B-repeat-containing protein, partial [Murimonas intestini]
MKKSVKRLMSCVLAMLFLVGTVFGNAGTLTAEASGDGGGTTYSGRIVYHLTDGKEDAGTGQEGTQEDTGEPVEGGELSEGGEGQEIPTDVTSEETGKTIEQAYSFVWDGVDEDLEAALKGSEISLEKVKTVLEESGITNEGNVAAGWKVKKQNPEAGEENVKVIRNAWDIPAELFRENQGGTIDLEPAWGKESNVTYSISNDGTEASHSILAITGEKYKVSGFEEIAGAAEFQTPENIEFTGWNTSWDGTGENYAAGSEVTLNEGGLVLYAQWQDTGAAGTEDTGTTEPVTEPQTGDDGTGSTELGTEPQTEPDGGTGSTEPGTENGWEPQTEPSNVGSPLGNGLPDFHTITFDGNGATYNVPEAVKALLAEGVYTTTIPDVTPELEGYSFNGWRDDEWNYYNPGAPVTVSTDVTLYADWTKTWKVTFEGNGQTGRNVPEPIIVREGDSLTLDETIPVPERDSYIFEGWSYNDTLYNTWDTIENITSDITLMASWKAVPVEFSITFDGQGATEGVPGNDSVEEGNPYTIPSDVPEKAGYIFKGWSDGQNVYAAGTDITDIKGNITLTAVWKGYYSITFDGQGATGGVVPQGASVEEESSYTIPAEVPEKTGYTFKGWSDGQNVYAAGTDITDIKG